MQSSDMGARRVAERPASSPGLAAGLPGRTCFGGGFLTVDTFLRCCPGVLDPFENRANGPRTLIGSRHFVTGLIVLIVLDAVDDSGEAGTGQSLVVGMVVLADVVLTAVEVDGIFFVCFFEADTGAAGDRLASPCLEELFSGVVISILSIITLLDEVKETLDTMDSPLSLLLRCSLPDLIRVLGPSDSSVAATSGRPVSEW